jgi:hypothetical protein
MEVLVTLKQAKLHLKVPLDVTADDKDLQMKLDVAHDVIEDYIKQRRDDDDGVTWAATVDAWDSDTAPARVRQAIVLQFADLYRFRGDDTDAPKRGPGELSQGVVALLYRLRDPAIA